METLSITHTCLWNGKYLDHQHNPIKEDDLHSKIKAVYKGKHKDDLLDHVHIKRAPLRLTEPMRMKR